MSQSLIRLRTAEEYELDAEAYCRSLPLEHFREGKPQAVQRSITVESFKTLNIRRADAQWFSEMLVQYVVDDVIQKVCPDNMLVVCDEPCRAEGSFAIELEPASPFMVLETVSPRSARKDYVDNFKRYEQDLQVPYCVIFDPARQNLDVFHLDGQHYERVEANTNGRFPVPEIDLEIGIIDGWVRFWHQGELLPIQPEIQELLKSKDEELQHKDSELQHKDEELQHKDEELQHQRAQLEELTRLLRSEVESKARQLGREDILDELGSDAVNAGKLQSWLNELRDG